MTQRLQRTLSGHGSRFHQRFSSARKTRLDVLEDTDGDDQEPVVGYVASGSAINTIRVAAATSATDLDVEEGRLLAVPIREQEVLFQITGAGLQDDHLGTQDRVRFRIEAQKLGSWNDATHAFDLVPWLPDPWTPVKLKGRDKADFDADGIGFVPGSRYSMIRYEPTAAVTHNTAILGILGSGKTTLACELICRNIDAGIKVLVLDITNQYLRFFDPLVPAVENTTRTGDINAATAGFHNNLSRDADGASFGSRGEFIRQIESDVHDFLAGPDQLRIYNPIAFNATTIDGYHRYGNAEAVRELSVVEKTALIAHAVLTSAMELGESAEPRVCLVIEEGHSLAPEPYDGLNNEDKRAVIMTARAVLQGRKYGYGSLLVTQRTANVTKTILNQCHTVFALRSYDATGMAFLANYLGDAYSKLLTSMPKFHCVAFGEGISCEAPVVLQLNDPQDFDRAYWAPRLPQLRDDRTPPEAAPAEEPDEDDIPF